jgi:hypothetical protein
MINRMFSEGNKVFKRACKLADTKPTIRQASKFRMDKGLAYTKKRVAIIQIENEKTVSI